MPINSHNLRPQRSDNNPTKGLENIPVMVETEIIKPSNKSVAPKLAAKIGNKGALPI